MLRPRIYVEFGIIVENTLLMGAAFICIPIRAIRVGFAVTFDGPRHGCDFPPEPLNHTRLHEEFLEIIRKTPTPIKSVQEKP